MRGKFILLAMTVVAMHCYGQDVINVSYDKATIINFPEPIKPKGVVVGNDELLEATPKGKLLYLRSMEEGIPETNLVVEMLSGAVYYFDIVYKVNQLSFINVTKVPNVVGNVLAKKEVKVEEIKVEKKEEKKALTEPIRTESSMSEEKILVGIVDSEDYLTSIGIVDNKMNVWIGGIYFFNGITYLKVNFLNNGHLPYSVLRVGLSVKKGSKGNSSNVDQSNRIEDVSMNKLGKTVVGYKEKMTLIVTVKKLSISRNNQLVMLISEEGGERDFRIIIESKDLLVPKTEF